MPIEVGEQHFVGKVSQRAIIRDVAGKYLLTKDVGATKWGAPGGRLHKGEEPLVGLKREVKEELGIDIEPRQVIHVEAERYSDGTDVFVLYYLADLTDANQTIVRDPVEVAETNWFSEADFKAACMDLWPSVQEAIELSQK